MRAVYLGDEAIVDCGAFTLDGRRDEGPAPARTTASRRPATRCEFHDPAALDPRLAASCWTLMTREPPRRGRARLLDDPRRRVFDPRRHRAAARGRSRRRTARPAAFCQYVPAADIDGCSLDLMRRRQATTLPNGAHRLRRSSRRSSTCAGSGAGGLGLNFAVHARGPGRRARRRAAAATSSAGCCTARRLDADRVAVALQRQVPSGVATALGRGRRGRACGCTRASRSRASESICELPAPRRAHPAPSPAALSRSIGIMSIAVSIERLRDEVARFGSTPYLLTVSDDAHARTRPPSRWSGGVTSSSWGRRSSRNAAAHPEVSLLWPPFEPGGYSLISDGVAHDLGDELMAFSPTKAVLHRPAPGQRASTRSRGDCSSDCVPLDTP